MTTPALQALRHALSLRRSRGLWRLPVVAVTGCALLVGTALSLHPAARADAITDKIGVAKQQLAQDVVANAQLKATIADTQAQEAVLREAIEALDAQVATADAQLSDARAQLAVIAQNLVAAQQALAATEARLAADKRLLSNEMVVLFKAQYASTTLTNFLNSGDFNGFWQHVLDVHRLATNEDQLVATVTDEQARVTAQVAAITQQKQAQATLVTTLHGLQQQLEQTLATRQQAAANLAAKQAQDVILLAQNEQSQKEVEAQIAQLQAEEEAALAAGGGSGRFAWPQTGPITQNFGCTTFTFEPYDANCSTLHFHSGIDIAAGCGTPIRAADAGIANVYYSSYGYGDHVIINHGNGWVSLYGHMQANFVVSNGEVVHRGQLLGYEGSTGNSTGCHLHFEIDRNGAPQNPLTYLS